MNRYYSWLILLLLMFMRVNLSAQVFDYIVAADGSGDFTSLQAAIDAVPDNVRKIIFVKAGTYEEKVMIGSHAKSSAKLLSIIGEDVHKTIITWSDYNGKTIVYDGKSVTSGTPQSATFTINASDFYAENLTITNPYTAKQAVALYNVGDRQTFKNCKLIGYQDTHYLKKGRRSYFYRTYIEGAIDYICAGGTAVFDSCTLYSVRAGSYITAPEDITAFTSVGTKKYYYGFIFRDCMLTSPQGVEVYLGRPWQGTSSSIYLNCTMENIKPQGWSVSSGDIHLTTFFAEYNSKKTDGSVLEVTQRVPWSYQLTQNEVDTYYDNDKIYSFVATPYNPFALIKELSKPQNLVYVDGKLAWTAVDNAKSYVILKNNSVIGFSTSNEFAVNQIQPGEVSSSSYTVRAVSDNGNLGIVSDPLPIVTSNRSISSSALLLSIKKSVIFVNDIADLKIFNEKGSLLYEGYGREFDIAGLNKGLLFIELTTENEIVTKKLFFE